jgi:predicted phosphodiesterase
MEKIAILADIHGNLAALQAVIADLDAWAPEMVIVAGDTVNRGPLSRACLDLVLGMVAERGWRLLRGNHERYVLSYDRERDRPDFPRSGPLYELSRVIAWTHAQVAEHVATIAALPEHLQLELDLGRLAVYHASTRHDRDGLTHRSSEAELRAQIDATAAIFCAGHTHMPFVRRLDQTLVVNVGAVGLPFDGDRRAAYARLSRMRTGWAATIIRLAYDVEATAQACHTSGMLAAVGPHGRLMLREIQTAQSLLFDFIPSYHGRIMAGELSIEAAVNEYLAAYGHTSL